MESKEEGGLNKEAPAPASSAGSAPKAPTLGPIKRARDSDPDPYIPVDDIPDLKLDNEAQAPAPSVGSSPKAPRLDPIKIGQGGARVDNPPNMGR